jgi:hypothetical protein
MRRGKYRPWNGRRPSRQLVTINGRLVQKTIRAYGQRHK